MKSKKKTTHLNRFREFPFRPQARSRCRLKGTPPRLRESKSEARKAPWLRGARSAHGHGSSDLISGPIPEDGPTKVTNLSFGHQNCSAPKVTEVRNGTRSEVSLARPRFYFFSSSRWGVRFARDIWLPPSPRRAREKTQQSCEGFADGHRCPFGQIDGPGKWNETHLNQCLLFLTKLG